MKWAVLYEQFLRWLFPAQERPSSSVDIDSPSMILAKMVCAEILQIEAFNLVQSEVHPATKKDLYKRCEKKLSTPKIEIVWAWNERNYSYEGPASPHYAYSETPRIIWHRCKPFGSGFELDERKMIEDVLAVAEKLQHERSAAKAIADRQQRAIDALANWMGVDENKEDA